MDIEEKLGVVCSWCRRIREGDGWRVPDEGDEYEPGPLASHGLCKECYEEMLDEFLAPVPVSGPDPRIAL